MILKFVDKHLHPFLCLYENANTLMHDDVSCIQEIGVLPIKLKKVSIIKNTFYQSKCPYIDI